MKSMSGGFNEREMDYQPKDGIATCYAYKIPDFQNAYKIA